MNTVNHGHEGTLIFTIDCVSAITLASCCLLIRLFSSFLISVPLQLFTFFGLGADFGDFDVGRFCRHGQMFCRGGTLIEERGYPMFCFQQVSIVHPVCAWISYVVRAVAGARSQGPKAEMASFC